MQAIRACAAATVRRDLKEPVAPVERSHEETGRRLVRTLTRCRHCSRDGLVPAPLWMGSQPQCSMHHQGSSCLDVLTLGSQIGSTLVTWSLPPSHIPPSMPSPIGASDSASDLVLVPCQRRLTSTWALFSRPHSRGPGTSSIWSAETTASSHSACPDAALSLCQSTWHPRSSAFMFSVSHGALSFSLGPRPLCSSWTRTPGQARSLPAFSPFCVSPWEHGHHALDMCSRLESAVCRE